jgi:O-antigen ligase
LTGTSNAAGDFSAFGLLLAVMFWSRLRAMDGILFYGATVPCLAVLLLSQSRMSFAALCLLGYFYHFATPRRASLIVLTGAAAFFIALGILSYEDDILSLLSRSGRASEVTTLSGRLAIWGVVLKLIGMNPLFGWGYASATQVLMQYTGEVGFNSISQAHNMMLQLTLTTGVIGALLFVVAVVDFFLRCYVNQRRDALTLMLFILVIGLTGPGAAYGMANSGVLALGLAIGFVVAEDRQGSKNAASRGYAVTAG